MSPETPQPSSPATPSIRSRRSRRRKDGGFTLPEVLVATSVVAIIATTLAAAITITFTQSTNSEGRLNVARAEQAIDTWLPADLASTDVNDADLPGVDLDPAANPCGDCSRVDLGGANALQLAWKTTQPGSPPTEVITRVQYQYVQRGEEWVIERIECIGSLPCKSITVLHDLEPPADPDTFDPDLERPLWVMDVAVPEPDASLELDDAARQVVVTVDGGGGDDGAAGGENTISLTAGGGETSEISADEFTVPSFVRANSRCGGLITLIVDESGSIGSDISIVEDGVEAFVEAFRGTPTQVQVVTMGSDAESIHPNPPSGTSADDGDVWHNYVDMTDEDQVDQLITRIGSRLNVTVNSSYEDRAWYDFGTNWEDAFFRALRDEDGSVTTNLPKRIVFFTDGLPSANRRSGESTHSNISSVTDTAFYNGTLTDENDGRYTHSSWPQEAAYGWSQRSWDRADVILDQHRDIDLIFVGVGSGLNTTVDWIHNPAVYLDRTEPASTATSMLGSETVTYLLMNGASGEVPAIYDSSAGEYTNPETANWYLQSDFDSTAFGAAMTAAALKDCGGTLTIQTRLEDGTPVSDEFVYENVEYRDESGTPIEAEARRVTTSSVFRTGTFDFEIAGGVSTFSVDVVPQELQTLSDYTPVGTNSPLGWSCRAAGADKPITGIDIDGSDFDGFTIDISANEAVSCILTVSN